jgi:putative sterol carrier protein
MAVKFLSDEWLSEVESKLNAHEGFQQAATGKTVKLQQVVSGAPQGDTKYGFVIEGGKVSMVPGDIEGADATINQDYETAAGLSKGELNGQTAFMSGKLKISGNMMVMMQLQQAFTVMPEALSDVDVEY